MTGGGQAGEHLRWSETTSPRAEVGPSPVLELEAGEHGTTFVVEEDEELLKAMGVKKPAQSQSDARAAVGFGAEPQPPVPPRYAPKYDVWGPID